MNQNGIFVKDVLSLDHVYLNVYGELEGRSIIPTVTAMNATADGMEDVRVASVSQLSRYLNKIWIVEGMSNCTIGIVGKRMWKVDPLVRFEEGMFDPADPESLANYQYETIQIESNAFSATLSGENLKLIGAEILDDTNTTHHYWQHVAKLVQDDLTAVLSVILDAPVEVGVDFAKLTEVYIGMDTSSTDYLKVYLNDADRLTIRGYTTRIFSKNSFSCNLISNEISNGILVNENEYVGDAVEDQYGSVIQFHPEEHLEETNRSLKIVGFKDRPNIDLIASTYVKCFPTNETYLKMSEGAFSGGVAYRT